MNETATITAPPPITAPVAAQSEVRNKTNVATRYVASNAAGAMGLLMILAGMPQDQAATLLSSLNSMNAALYDFIGAFSSAWYIAFPVVSVWLGKMGVDASGFGAMINKVLAAAKAGNVAAQVQVVQSAGALLASHATPAAASHEVKAALIDATAALPEVVGKITVTDDKLAEDTVSTQVVKTEGMHS